MPKPARRLDLLAFVFSLAVIIVSGYWVAQQGIFAASLTNDQTLSWHLVRSAGITAYLLLTAATGWGLLVSTGAIRDWSPGSLSTMLHNTLSYLALSLGGIHAVLLLWDKYYTYTLGDILIPFTGPYRPEVVGLGTLALWLLAVITFSFLFKRRIGYKNWKRLHYTSYAAYILVTLHGLFAGTDSDRLGFRLLIGLCVLAVTVLFAIRWRMSVQGMHREKTLRQERQS
jgi:predicted ferric reductase